MLQVQGLTKGYAGRTLLEAVTWNVSDGDRVGLTGPNGAGKTTLLRLIVGTEHPDEGKVTMPKGTTVGYLPQDGLTHAGKSVREEALSAFNDVLAIGAEIQKLEEKMGAIESSGAEHDSVLERYGELREEFDRRGGFSIESQAEEVLLGLGFKKSELEMESGKFSGGWQMRIALAKLLLSRPGVLLLDEPTNHLDLEARNWLEAFLASYPHAVVMVSHDRFFMDQVVNRITEIDRRKLVDYTGNYSKYLSVRANTLAELRAKAARQRDEIEKMKRFIDRFRAKATKAKQVQSRVKMLEKIELIEVPPERKLMRLRLPEPERSGRVVLELEDVHKSYGPTQVFNGASFVIERGERLALVGPNGVGKSTLMRLLSEKEAPDSGQVKPGHNVKRGYFSQDRYDLDENRTVLENMADGAPVEMMPRLRNILGAFLFHGDDVDKKVKVLSGGEKSRLALARLLLKPANVLLLDEPTNHLDLDSKEILLDALRAYQGTLVFVSHDRYFLDELATKVAEIGDGQVALHWGGYPEYIAAKERELNPEAPPELPQFHFDDEAEEESAKPEAEAKTEPEPEPEPVGPARKPSPSISKNRARELRERVEELEKEIAETEIGIESLEARMSVPGFYDDPAMSQPIVSTHEGLKEKLKALYEEWESISEKVAG